MAVVELQFCNIVIASATKQPRPAFTLWAGMSGKRKSRGKVSSFVYKDVRVETSNNKMM
jgi:hypothetical protein